MGGTPSRIEQSAPVKPATDRLQLHSVRQIQLRTGKGKGKRIYMALFL